MHVFDGENDEVITFRIFEPNQKTPSVRDLSRRARTNILFSSVTSVYWKREYDIRIQFELAMMYVALARPIAPQQTQRIRSSLPLYFSRFARYINLRIPHSAAAGFF